jgi:hypothetical protein
VNTNIDTIVHLSSLALDLVKTLSGQHVVDAGVQANLIEQRDPSIHGWLMERLCRDIYM